MLYIKTLLLYAAINYMSRPILAMLIHVKCRNNVYPRSNITRFPVPDEKVNWSIEYSDYNPPTHNAASIIGKPWADLDIKGEYLPPTVTNRRDPCELWQPASAAAADKQARYKYNRQALHGIRSGDPNFHVKWNTVDGNVNRVSYMGSYEIADKCPLNPIGRTGICGRGVLGRWGPNHAADPIVTRWKKIDNGDSAIHQSSQKPLLQFVAIKRGDTGEWALPGGMVDPGEHVTQTAVREFQEEATNSLVMTEDEKVTWQVKFDKFFNRGDEVYKGYVDDPRNTDNSWMETVAYNFHDESGTTVGKLRLHAGDDAVGVRWVDATSELKLYASHRDIVQAVVEMRKAHWS